MKDFFKAFWKRVSNPPVWGLLLAWGITLASVGAALTIVFIGYVGWISYLAYALAALSLAYTVYVCVSLAPALKKRVRARLQKGRFTRAMTENYSFRTLVLTTCSFVLNIAFVLFNTAFAILTGNAWFGALAGYYFLLSVLRGGVFYLDGRAKKRGDYALARVKNYRLCGVALFLLDVAMAVAVTMMVAEQKPTRYGEITAIVFATWSVYKISFAIWNIFKARRTKDWQIQAFRNIGLADAAISLLSLQTTLVATFSAEGESMLLLNATTGAFVCLFTVGMGILMIIQANKKMKEERDEGK